MDYSKWTTEELIRLQVLVGAEGEDPEEKAAIALELRRRQAAAAPAPAPAPAPTEIQTNTAPATTLDADAADEVGKPSTWEKNKKKILIAAGSLLVGVLGIAAFSGTSASDLEKNSRAYVAQASACEAGAEIALQPDEAASDFDIADNITQARDICETARTNLLTMSTGGFGDEADEIWSGVDSMKSGLNAFLAYTGDQSPAKLVEAKNKLVGGKAAIEDGVEKINSIRAENDLAGL